MDARRRLLHLGLQNRQQKRSQMQAMPQRHWHKQHGWECSEKHARSDKHKQLADTMSQYCHYRYYCAAAKVAVCASQSSLVVVLVSAWQSYITCKIVECKLNLRRRASKNAAVGLWVSAVLLEYRKCGPWKVLEVILKSGQEPCTLSVHIITVFVTNVCMFVGIHLILIFVPFAFHL